MAHRPRLPPPADAEQYDDFSELERERHENDMRLKSTFEHIFEKYSRDFTDIGDEVDLETGEIVVNNGHLARLDDERDTGEGFEEWYDDEDEDDDEPGDEDPYGSYGVADRLEEDGLLSSSAHNRNQRTSTTHHSPNTTMSRRPQNRPHPRDPPHHRIQPAHPARTPRPPPEHQHTPQRVDFAQDPAFFQALGQSIAQGIAQYMSGYQDSPRASDPMWDAPPLPRSSHAARRPAPPTESRRRMIPESPRQPAQSLWSTGRSVGRPRLQPRPAEPIPEPSPSIRNNAISRQQLVNVSPNRPRYPIPQWNEVEPEEEGDDVSDETEGNGQQEEDIAGVQYEDDGQVGSWMEDANEMDTGQLAEAENEDSGRAFDPEEIGNSDSFQAITDMPMVAQRSAVTDDSHGPKSIPPVVEITRTADRETLGEADTHITVAVQPSPGSSTTQTPRGKGRKNRLQPAWTAGDDELFILLKEERKLSFGQIARYFPDRTPKNLENHWYKRLASRPNKTRGPMSDYVRRALQRGPIMAYAVRNRPYVPKNPDNPRPHLANLDDQTELMEYLPAVVPDSDSDSAERLNQEPTATPTGPVLPDNEIQSAPSPVAEDEAGSLFSTGDPVRPWGCTKCRTQWASKRGAKYHFADPGRCIPVPNRPLRPGRKPLHAVPKQAEPPKLIIPGVDLSTGKRAPFNPNILVREEMERTHLCTLCGKSWASHSNAREHTKRPETCIPENWLTNYHPGAHRKKVSALEPAEGSAQESQKSQKPGPVAGSTSQAQKPKQPDPVVESRERQPSKRQEPVGGSISKGNSAKRQKKGNSAPHQLLEAATRAQPHSSMTNVCAQQPVDSNSRPMAQEMDEVQIVQQPSPEPVSTIRRGFPKRFTVSDKPEPTAGPSQSTPARPNISNPSASKTKVVDRELIDPRLIDTSKVMDVVQQYISVPQVAGLSPRRAQGLHGPAAVMANGETPAAGADLAARDDVSFSSNDVQTPSTTNQNVFRMHVQPTPPSTQLHRSQEEERPRSHTKQRKKLVSGSSSTPSKDGPTPVDTNPTTQNSKPLQNTSEPSIHDVSTSSGKKTAFTTSIPALDMQVSNHFQKANRVSGQKRAPPDEILPAPDPDSSLQVPGSMPKAPRSQQRPSLPKPSPKNTGNVRMKATPSKPIAKSAAAQISQSARPANPTSSTSQLAGKAGPVATPKNKMTSETARSSPLSRIVKSEPRPETYFIDLLAGESEDELAL